MPIQSKSKTENSSIRKEHQIKAIQKHFHSILEIMGLDLKSDSLKDTPLRVAKMFVNEIFSGLDESNKPKISLFKNDSAYKHMLIEKNIQFYSTCEHHFMPIIGKAHIAYIPKDKIIGLSKINRLVSYYAHRPQVQERLTSQLSLEFQNSLQTKDVAILIEAQHLCISARGIRDQNSTTVTSGFSGVFLKKEFRENFLLQVYEKKIK